MQNSKFKMQTQHASAGPGEMRRDVHPVASMYALFAFVIVHFALQVSLQ